MGQIRKTAVAGRFYPARAGRLQQAITDYLDAAAGENIIPKAIIAPHAGYIYSGPIAASAYKWLVMVEAGAVIKRVVLLGPSHFAPFRGLALSRADAFATPLGNIPLDKSAAAQLKSLPQVIEMDAAHRQEHSLEVHLPFLQTALGSFQLLPLAVGETTPAAVSEVLEAVWGGPETLIVVSSDLSHYHPYPAAKKLDRATAQAIEALQPDKIGREQACGRVTIQGLLSAAKNHNLTARTVDLRNSGDTAGPKDQVVGYGAWVFVEGQAA